MLSAARNVNKKRESSKNLVLKLSNLKRETSDTFDKQKNIRLGFKLSVFFLTGLLLLLLLQLNYIMRG